MSLRMLAELVAEGDPRMVPARGQIVFYEGQPLLMRACLDRTAVFESDDGEKRYLLKLNQLFVDPDTLVWQLREVNRDIFGWVTPEERRERGRRGAHSTHSRVKAWRCTACNRGEPVVTRYNPKSGKCIECAKEYNRLKTQASRQGVSFAGRFGTSTSS